MPHASPEKRRAYAQVWRGRNRDKIRRDAKEWARKNPDRVRANRAKWRARTKMQRAHYRVENKPRFLIYHARSRARRAGIPFDLTVDNVYWPKTCPVFGFKLNYGATKSFASAAPSLDRLDPKKGYTASNVRVISWRANAIKRDASVEEIAALLQWLRRELR